MREIVLDTETTGMEPAEGHKLVEIGCLELINHMPTGKTWHHYINPERDIPAEATAVHGITIEAVRKKPVFSQLFTDFLDFIGDSRLVIHNAEFDMKFINAELSKVGAQKILMTRVTDTLTMARKKFPGSPANLDALCRRFGVDNSGREFHGALLDAQLLAEVYLELLGGRQHGLGLASESAAKTQTQSVSMQATRERVYRDPRPHVASEVELAAHAKMVEGLKEPLWSKV